MKIYKVLVKYNEDNNELYHIFHTVAENEDSAKDKILNSDIIQKIYNSPSIEQVYLVKLQDCIW